MSRPQERPRVSRDLQVEACSKTHGTVLEKVCEALEKTSLSSQPLVPEESKEAPDAGIASASEASFCSSATAMTATSSSTSEKGSFSQEGGAGPGPSLAEAEPRNVLSEALDEKAALLVNFMLLKYELQEPLSKREMLKMVIREHKQHFTKILQKASERLEMVFGLDVKEVDPTNHRYALSIKLGLTYDGMLSGEEGVPKTGILILILGVIFMKGNCASEEEIWEVLNLSGIYPGVKHFILEEPREFITKELVREEYLVSRQVANSDPAQFEFLWGPRAFAETTKMKVLEFLAKVQGADPSCFPCQYEEALQDEAERAQAGVSAGAPSPSVATASSSAKSGRFPVP